MADDVGIVSKGLGSMVCSVLLPLSKGFFCPTHNPLLLTGSRFPHPTPTYPSSHLQWIFISVLRMTGSVACPHRWRHCRERRRSCGQCVPLLQHLLSPLLGLYNQFITFPSLYVYVCVCVCVYKTSFGAHFEGGPLTWQASRLFSSGLSARAVWVSF